MQDYRKLKVSQKAHAFALEAYAVSKHLKALEAWPLRDQLLRALISVPSNIAEGAGRGTDPDFGRFLKHSLGSINEVEYDLLLARDLGFLPAREYSQLSAHLEEVRRMLCRLIATVNT
jgi:four helix bundle protein